MEKSKIDDVLSITDSMSLDEQYTFLDKFKQRLIERKRNEIAQNAKETLEAVKSGHAQFGSVDDFLKDMDEE
jgi:hypothetical protein